MKNKRFMSFVARLLTVIMLIACVPVIAVANPEAPAGLQDISGLLHASETIADDGRIGIPVNVHTYYDETKSYKPFSP